MSQLAIKQFSWDESFDPAPVAETIERPWLRRYTRVLPFLVIGLIFAGAMVTSHEAGLSVPDWPTTYGQNMFLFPYSQWHGGIFYEHLHRLIASGIGLLTVILAVWVGRVEERRWVRYLAYGALAAVVAQGVLGGLTVLFLLPKPISISHAILAQTFLVLTVIIAYSQSQEFATRKRGELLSRAAIHYRGTIFRWSLLIIGLIYLQLFLGALMRHTGAGLAILDFPRMAGSYLPAFDQGMIARINDLRFSLDLPPVTRVQVITHFLHRLGAIIVSASIVAFTCSILFTRKRLALPGGGKLLWRSAFYLGTVVCLQFLLGVVTVLSLKSPIITSLHVALGASLLALCVLCALRSARIETVR